VTHNRQPASVRIEEVTAMYSLFVFIHIIVCVGLILVVLFQAGKGAGLGNLSEAGGRPALSAPSGTAFIKK